MPGSEVCASWDFDLQSWSRRGCNTVTGESGTTVTCTCNHLTNFAVLVVTIRQFSLSLSLSLSLPISLSLPLSLFSCPSLSSLFLLRNDDDIFDQQDICLRLEDCQPINPVVDKILSFVSYIGIIISIIGLVLTITTMLIFK